MITLGGSPMRVNTPPRSAAIASPKRKGTEEIPNTSAMDRVTGTKVSMVVTLSRNMETTALAAAKAKNKVRRFPLDHLAALMAMN